MSRIKAVWEEDGARREKLFPLRFDSYTVTEAPCLATDMSTGAKFDPLNGNQLKFELDIPDDAGNIKGSETLYFPFGQTVYVISDDRKRCEASYPRRANRRLAVAERK